MKNPVGVLFSALHVLALLPVFLLGSAPGAGALTASLYAAVNGEGTSCTSAVPCQLTTALSRARPGDRVELLAGNYPKLTVPAQSGPTDTSLPNVVIEPAPGAAVTMAGLDTYASRHTWRNIAFRATVMIRQAANNVSLDTVSVEGAGAYIRGQNIAVVNSLFQNGHATDGLQIGQAKDVLVEGNTIRNYSQGDFGGYHSDCIQMFDSTGITIRGNLLSNCYNAALIFSPGMGRGTHEVLIESNFVQGCVAAFCTGGVTLDMRATTENTNITVRNNTFVGDSARFGALPGLVFDRNIVEYVSYCDAPMTNTIVMSWNRGLCAQPAAVGRNGTRTGTVDFANAAAGDFHLTEPGQAYVDGWGALVPAPRDYDGDATTAFVAGADSPAGLKQPDSQPDTVAPTVNLVSPRSGAVVSGLVTVTATAADDVGVVSVSFWADKYQVAKATRQGDGTWAAIVDSRNYPNMETTLRASALDAAGNEGRSPGIVVRTSN